MLVRGVHVPDFMYGTAWKEDRTEDLVVRALAAGFRAIDTANQRKHYFEAGVGAGIARAGIPRAELFVQTKFTHVDGQDERLPYDRDAPVEMQVAQSFERSLEHLGTHVDSLVMHGPTQRIGLGPDDHAVWRGMEALADRVALLGVSNVNAGQLADLLAFARVPPAFVQNRCYASRGWDADVRAICAERGIVYQGFSLLTANRDVWQYHRDVKAIAKRHGVTPQQVIFAFARQRGMLPLTGTASPIHMREDLASLAIELGLEELGVIETSAVS
jgi:diketogulonate reductase-like aldo/keto reductase